MIRPIAARPAGLARLSLVATVLLSAAAPAGAAVYQTGFDERPLVSGLTQPVAVDWAPDGRMFIAEKEGRVRVVAAGGGPDSALVLDISDHVESAPSHGHRGLLGIAVDSDFEANHHLYLLYTHLPPGASPGGPKSSRLTRVEVADDNTAGPETVLLGTESAGACPAAADDVDCIPADGPYHSVGTVKSDPDGTIWVGSGDGNANQIRAQNEASFAGKLIHVDRNGRGLSGHAFCPGNDDLTDVCTKIHAKGFRNPYRFTLRADGRPAVGDVGDRDREELDLAAKGRNYGWPCYEGTMRTPGFSGLAGCQDLYAKEGSPEEATPPVYEYPRGTGAAIVGGPTYEQGPFPDSFDGQLFVGDFLNGFIRALEVGPGDEVIATSEFATGWSGVALERTPWDTLAYVDFGDGSAGSGSVREIRYAAPSATAGSLGGVPPPGGGALPVATTPRPPAGPVRFRARPVIVRLSRMTSSRSLRLSLRSAESFALTGALRLSMRRRSGRRTRTVALAGPRTFSLPARGRASMTLRLNRAARRALRDRRRVGATLTLDLRSRAARKTLTQALALRVRAFR